jgi:glycosyltransferase involved in cell wall biosynthesis
MKKIIYISERKFPDGNAGGVRTLYMAKLLKEYTGDVHVLSVGDVKLNSQLNCNYQGVSFLNIGVFKNRFVNYFLNGIRLLKKTKSITKKLSSNEYLLVIYSTNIIFISYFLLFFNLKKNIAFDVVENFGRDKFSRFDVRYFLFKILYNKIYKKSKFNFIISREMASHFSETSCIFIPSIIDINNYEVNSGVTNQEKVKLIYFGTPFGKENVTLMLNSFIDLVNNDDNFELHFTGVTIEDFYQLEIYKNVKRYLNKSIFIHGWVEHSDMKKLVQESSFLFFIRDETHTNKYNFPTKLAESFAMGLPCICNLYGPYSEFVHKKNSIIIENLSKSAVVKKMKCLSSIGLSEYSELCKNARKTAEIHFNYKSYNCELRRFLGDVL